MRHRHESFGPQVRTPAAERISPQHLRDALSSLGRWARQSWWVLTASASGSPKSVLLSALGCLVLRLRPQRARKQGFAMLEGQRGARRRAVSSTYGSRAGAAEMRGTHACTRRSALSPGCYALHHQSMQAARQGTHRIRACYARVRASQGDTGAAGTAQYLEWVVLLTCSEEVLSVGKWHDFVVCAVDNLVRRFAGCEAADVVKVKHVHQVDLS